MPIRLISEDERQTITVAGAQIHYRRIPSYIQRRIEQKHTKRGLVDQRAMVDEALEYAILGWDDVENEQGQAVGYSAALIPYLPEEARAEIVQRLYEADPVDAALKNSRAGTPAS